MSSGSVAMSGYLADQFVDFKRMEAKKMRMEELKVKQKELKDLDKKGGNL